MSPVLGLIFAANALSTFTVVVPPDGSTTFEFDAKVDDTHLANPPGYFPSEPPVAQVVSRVSVANVGNQPALQPVLRVNGRPYLTMTDPLDFLGVRAAPDPLALYEAWIGHRMHGTTNLDANHDAVEVLRSIGATFCGDDTRALGRLLAPAGIDTRFAQVAGHSVAEYNFGGDRWTLLDGDQNAFYLLLDNRTLASEADLLADPFPVLRTRVYGRQADWSRAAAAQNAARFEFVEPGKQKNFRVKGEPAPTDWTLLPGERLTFHPDLLPDAVFAASMNLALNEQLVGGARLVNFEVDLTARREAGIALQLPFPILALRDEAGETRIANPGEEPVLEIELPPGDRATLVCQVTPMAIPTLRVGENDIRSDAASALQIEYQINPAASELREVDPPTVQVDAIFENHIPAFRVDGPAERIWWQVSDDVDFRVVPPNFDTVADFDSKIRLRSQLDRTFLSADRKHYFRAKIRRDGVWSDWCQPVTFTTNKPEQPVITEILVAADELAEVSFEKQDVRMRLYGSNRLDFLPQIFSDTEPTRIENNRVVESRPNENFLSEVDGNRGFAIVPLRRFYRLIAENGGAFSVPSTLGKLPPGTNVPPARVLQNRHLKPEGSLIGRDVATEQSTSGW